MGYEIDFHSVGEESQSGDAISLRFGDLFGDRTEQTVIVIDGGFKDSGQKLVEHIKKYYKTEKVDLVISTHPDADHSSGLEVVLDELEVSKLWMHLPWNHTEDINKMFKDGRVTDEGVKASLRKSLESARLLESLAKKKEISVEEPFAGLKDVSGRICVLGPTEKFYESLLPEFRGTPESKFGTTLEKAISGVKEVIRKIKETWDIETLNDNGETSAENNSSTVLMAEIDDKLMLFTADAGIPALTEAVDLLENAEWDKSKLDFIQVPHHGSRRNVGPSLLDRLIGHKLVVEEKNLTAFVSVAKDGEPKHPSKKVLNAFKRRGASVYTTKGKTVCHSEDSPKREGWVSAEAYPFYSEVEEESQQSVQTNAYEYNS